MLDDLVGVIETLQGRIEQHRPALLQSEALTRYALIDPLLRALGWDTADPALVTPEYSVGNGRADYALLSGNGKPQAFIEAKKLDETLESPRNVEQVFTYALTQQVKYAGLTDGNRWVLDDVSDFSGGDRRKLSVSLSGEPAHQLALRFLLLWRPNLATGEPAAAREPILAAAAVPAPVAPPPAAATVIDPQPSVSQTITPSIAEEWVRLADCRPETGSKPPAIRLPDGAEKQLDAWTQVIYEVAEHLVKAGSLTAARCPIQVAGGTRYVVHTVAVHANNRVFGTARKLSNGLFCEGDVSGVSVMTHAKTLLQHCGVDAGAVWLKLG